MFGAKTLVFSCKMKEKYMLFLNICARVCEMGEKTPCVGACGICAGSRFASFDKREFHIVLSNSLWRSFVKLHNALFSTGRSSPRTRT